MLLRQLPIIALGFFLFSCARNNPPAPQSSAVVEPAELNVRQFGAIGDGATKDTVAFQKALDACAARAGGGDVLVPAGNYLIGSVVLGPNTTLRLEKDSILTASPDIADFPLMEVRWEGRWREGHRALIYANKADHIAIIGPGKIVGDSKLAYLRNPRGPCLIEPIECNDVRLQDFSISYRRMWAIHPTYCSDLVASGLTIRSSLSNGDGIDVDSCQRVRIERCDIDSGDDAIALKSGRGMEAVRIARPTEDVLITDCRLGSDFAGLGIGSEMSGGIRNVRIERCVFTRGSNSIFLKGRIGRGGFVEGIHGRDLVAQARTFLRFNFVTTGIQDSEPVEGPAAIPNIKNISFTRIRSSASTLVDASRISPDRPVEGFTLSDVSGTCKSGMTLCSMSGVELRDIRVTGHSGPLLVTRNVSGTGLMGAAPYNPPATQGAQSAGTP